MAGEPPKFQKSERLVEIIQAFWILVRSPQGTLEKYFPRVVQVRMF
jgi:hypothetical protein